MADPATDSFTASLDRLHDRAMRATGLDDFGDPSYRTALEVLADSLDHEADLSEMGRMIFEGQIANTLANRLRSQKRLDERPELADAEIKRPIIITGLVRTGSTALHYLMGRDPDLQPLPYWLAAHPQPRPPREEWVSSADFQASVDELAFLYEHTPELMAVHEMRADWPEECRHLLEQSFVDDRFEVAATLPGYARWYHDNEHIEAYRRHRLLVALIGSTDTQRRWLLKYPVHLRQLPALLTVYPDACVIQTHRDPAAVIASYTSFIAKIRAMHERTVDVSALARELVESWAHAAEAGMAAREAHGDESQFIDVYFDDFMEDPIGSVRRVGAYFDHELSEQGEQQLEAWQREHPQGKHGRHVYDAERTGISQQEIRDRFSSYLDRFGL